MVRVPTVARRPVAGRGRRLALAGLVAVVLAGGCSAGGGDNGRRHPGRGRRRRRGRRPGDHLDHGATRARAACPGPAAARGDTGAAGHALAGRRPCRPRDGDRARGGRSGRRHQDRGGRGAGRGRGHRRRPRGGGGLGRARAGEPPRAGPGAAPDRVRRVHGRPRGRGGLGDRRAGGARRPGRGGVRPGRFPAERRARPGGAGRRRSGRHVLRGADPAPAGGRRIGGRGGRDRPSGDDPPRGHRRVLRQPVDTGRAPRPARLLWAVQAQHLHLRPQGRPLPPRPLARAVPRRAGGRAGGPGAGRPGQPRPFHLRRVARRVHLLRRPGRPGGAGRQARRHVRARRALVLDRAGRHRPHPLELRR